MSKAYIKQQSPHNSKATATGPPNWFIIHNASLAILQAPPYKTLLINPTRCCSQGLSHKTHKTAATTTAAVSAGWLCHNTFTAATAQHNSQQEV